MFFAFMNIFRAIFLWRYANILKEQKRKMKKRQLMKTAYFPEHELLEPPARRHIVTRELGLLTMSGSELLAIEPPNDPLYKTKRTRELRFYTRYEAFTTPEIVEYLAKATEGEE